MDVHVARTDLPRVRTEETARAELAEGDARISVDAFALTSNNVTYAVFGEAMRYWDFFPVDGDESGEWGRIPVWGFGEVVESRSADVVVGERLYGYYPMSSSLVITPGRADERGVSDVAPHRAEMASAYSRYVRCAADPLYRADREAHQMLLYPLFFTSFLIDDFLLGQGDFGATQIVVSSASSKTAIGVAHLAQQRGARVVGLTSPSHVGFVEELGIYDRVVTYDELDQLEVVPSVYVDIAGNRDVLSALHHRLSGVLAHSMAVGGTHWDHQAAAAPEDVPPPAPAFFFAPTQISLRSKEWGRDELDRRMGEAWVRFADWTDTWIDIRRVVGASGVTAVYRDLLAGSPEPRAGFICSL
jgi:NADPH:quinone reductase-like Zn-dependent oxidoreductase